MPKPSNLLITSPSNIRYLSNFTGSSGFMLITKTKSYLFTDARYVLRAQNSIKKDIEIIDTTRMWRNQEELEKNWHKILKKHKITELGIEENNLTISRFKSYQKFSKPNGKALKFTDISNLIEKKRENKEKNELKLIEKSQRINEKVFLEVEKIILEKSSLTEIELAWKIRELGHTYGAEDLSFDPIVAFGKNSASPHHSPGKDKLKSKEIVLVDMGMKYQGYCSDMTRMVFKGKPSDKEVEIYETVLLAQVNAIKNIKAGITGQKADWFARDVIEKAGYGDFFSHSGGHGIGLDIHESPSLSANFKEKIAENTVITIEPGIYLPGKFGVRIEDMLLITKTGNKNLTKVRK